MIAFTRGELIVVLIIIIGFIGLLYPAVQDSRWDYAGWAEPLPAQLPLESRRVFHKSGFSIVFPDGWRQPEGIAYQNQAKLEARSGYRHESSLTVQLAKPNLHTTRFIDDWAFGDLTLKSWQTGYDGSQFGTRWYAFETLYPVGDRQYLISFSTHADVHSLPDSIASYIRTFRPPERE